MNPIPPDAAKDRLIDEFHAVVAETEQLLKSVAGASSEKAGALKSSVAQGLADAGERLAKIREDSLEQARAVARTTDGYVRDNPWRAVGIIAAVAAVTGVVAGLLIARR